MSYLILGGQDGGIGAAIASELDDLGCNVIATDRSLDVRSYWVVDEGFSGLSAMMERDEDRLEGVVYTAGVNYLSWLGKMDQHEMTIALDILQTNAWGFINVLNAIVRHRMDDGRLPVVAISSDAATRPLRTSAAYCASKAALDAIVRVSARELGGSNIRVNAVSPGMVEGTGMSDEMDRTIPPLRGWTEEEMLNYERSQEVVPGRVTPEEVAKVVVSTLFGPPHLNGAIIPVNGGR